MLTHDLFPYQIHIYVFRFVSYILHISGLLVLILLWVQGQESGFFSIILTFPPPHALNSGISYLQQFYDSIHSSPADLSFLIYCYRQFTHFWYL